MVTQKRRRRRNRSEQSTTTRPPPPTVLPMAQLRTVRSDKAPSELVNFRISAEDRQRIDRIARRRGVTVSEVLRRAVLRELDTAT